MLQMKDITELMDVNTYPDLHCSQCNSLLSRPPILINVNGNNLCGRCETNDTGLLLHNIYFETLAHQFRFPCTFNNEGCKLKKPFGKIKEHEEKCPYQTKQCGVKTCEWSGIPTEMIIHYRKYHEELITDCLEKKVLYEDVSSFILVSEGFYFLIEWCYSEFKLKLSVMNLYLLDLNCDITFNYNLSISNVRKTGSIKLNGSVILILEDVYKNPIASTTSFLLSIHAKLSTDNINMKTEALNKILCPNCNCQMIPPILECPEGHFTCVDCTDDDYDYCKRCDEDELRFKRVSELEIIATSLIYKCKWKDCGEDYSVRDIEEHQRVCSKRLHICLHCPLWKGLLSEISAHLRVCTATDYICPMFTSTEFTIQGTIDKEEEYSLIAHEEQFYIFFRPIADEELEVAVCNTGPPSLFGWYSYEVILRHAEDLNFPIRTYNINSTSGKRYTQVIPISDIAIFGGKKFVKITLKINLLSKSDRFKNVAKYFVWFK